jgi:SAM-dependent methyltransferase
VSGRWADDAAITVPGPARVYDYLLGGVRNFVVDREFAAQLLRVYLQAELLAHANRAFLGRAVRWLAQAGIRQFLDIGSGVPDLGAVHEIAQAEDPAARIVYADLDPVIVDQARAMLTGNPNVLALQGDLRTPGKILYHPQVVGLLDFAEPVAVLTVAVWPFIADAADPPAIVDRIADALAPGSYLVVSHPCPADTPQERAQQDDARLLYQRTPTPVVLRDRTQISRLFGSAFELLRPGLATAATWLPDPDEPAPAPSPALLAAVGRRRSGPTARAPATSGPPRSREDPPVPGSSY